MPKTAEFRRRVEAISLFLTLDTCVKAFKATNNYPPKPCDELKRIFDISKQIDASKGRNTMRRILRDLV